MREPKDMPPSRDRIESPYDGEARYCIKNATEWSGYKVHLTETCDAHHPHLITHVVTTEATVRHTIPEKTDSQAARLRKGARGGRPPGFDEERYKKRNTVERAINRLKHARAVATHYDKRGYVFLGTATAAALVIWLRA